MLSRLVSVGGGALDYYVSVADRITEGDTKGPKHRDSKCSYIPYCLNQYVAQVLHFQGSLNIFDNRHYKILCP